jgi:hypothetical protein
MTLWYWPIMFTNLPTHWPAGAVQAVVAEIVAQMQTGSAESFPPKNKRIHHKLTWNAAINPSSWSHPSAKTWPPPPTNSCLQLVDTWWCSQFQHLGWEFKNIPMQRLQATQKPSRTKHACSGWDFGHMPCPSKAASLRGHFLTLECYPENSS